MCRIYTIVEQMKEKKVEILYKIDLSSKGVNLSLICIFKYSIIIKSIYINLVWIIWNFWTYNSVFVILVWNIQTLLDMHINLE